MGVCSGAGQVPASTPLLLFVCTHNAGRSQIAAALLAEAAGDRVTVASARTALTGEGEPTVVSALAEVGIDATDASPKPFTEEVVAGAGCCGDHGLL